MDEHTEEQKVRRRVSTRQFIVCGVLLAAGSYHLFFTEAEGFATHDLVVGGILIFALLGMFLDFGRVQDWVLMLVEKWRNRGQGGV